MSVITYFVATTAENEENSDSLDFPLFLPSDILQLSLSNTFKHAMQTTHLCTHPTICPITLPHYGVF